MAKDELIDCNPPGRFKIEYFDDINGKGLVPLQDFETGDFLLSDRGQQITKLECEQSKFIGDIEYVFVSPSHKMKIDATSCDSEITRFLNNSVPVRAKAFPKLYVNAQVLYCIKFFTLRPIKTGERTTYDYGRQYMP